MRLPKGVRALRKQRVSLAEIEFELASGCDSDSAVSEKTRRRIIRRALLSAIETSLTERQRQMLLLYYSENEKMSEIAAELGVNKSTVSRTLSKAREKLSESLSYLNNRNIFSNDNTDY